MRKEDIAATAHARLLLLGLGFSVRVRVVGSMGGAAHVQWRDVYFSHDLLIFPDTGGHLGLSISTFWDQRLVSSAKWMILTKLSAYRTNRFDVIQFSVNFSFSSAAILDFEKWRFDIPDVILKNNRFEPYCLCDIKAKLRTKFGENQSKGSEVIQVFVNFIIAAPPSWIPLFSNFLPIFLFIATSSMLERNLVHVA